MLSVCALELLVFGLIFGLACFASRATRDDLRLRWQGKIKPVLWGAGYSVGLRLALALLVIVIGIGLIATRVMTPDSLKDFVSTNRPGVETLIDVAAMRNNPVYFWLTLTVVSFVVAGLREELWRSAFLAGMKALWPQHFGSRAGQGFSCHYMRSHFWSRSFGIGFAGGLHGRPSWRRFGIDHGFSWLNLACGLCPRNI
jgi:hypothetical protein